jgi:hypothetical protein
MIRHTITLSGPTAEGPRISAHVLRPLLDALVDAAQRSLRLRVEGRSNLQRKARWLDAATDIQFVGLHGGSTVLEWEAPALGEAAPEIFEQLPLWDFSPRREQSALSLVEEAVRDAAGGNTESDLLDPNVLEAITRFRRVRSLSMPMASRAPPSASPVMGSGRRSVSGKKPLLPSAASSPANWTN